MKKILRTIIFVAVLLGSLGASAQGFFNLTAEEVEIDTLLPRFSYSRDIGYNYADSAYSVEIEYPEFVDMTEADIRRYQAITSDPLPEMPVISQNVSVSRKSGSFDVSFVPLVFRDGKYRKLVSFKLSVSCKAVARPAMSKGMLTRATTEIGRYASESVLRNGTWAKIRVSSSGVHQLTDALIRQAGFSSPDKVRIYGYGGALLPEKLTDEYLRTTDDLQQVPVCTVGGRRLFYANGPVYWTSANARVRNPYSDYGYYFITESDEAALTVDSAAFVSSFYPAGEDYNTLYEVDNYSWFHGGRNLYDSKAFTVGTANNYTLAAKGASPKGSLTVALTANGLSTASVSVNDSVVGKISIKEPGKYDAANMTVSTFALANIAENDNKVTVTQTSGGTMRLDYITLHTNEPKASPMLSSVSFPVPEYVYRITNQNHHADGAADMIIIIPTTQKRRSHAERLKALREQKDGMRVRIVPADELYNEFSSGTPDATAYRRYLKMLYDRAVTEADMPKYLVLFGDGAWDNRMLTSDWRNYSPDDFLLCFESENSFSDTDCYVSDDYFCLLDDGEMIHNGSGSYDYLGKPDVAVGRFPVRTDDEAATMVDKVVAYDSNANAGSWQNTIVVMGDDGNNNIHMITADSVALMIGRKYPGYNVKKIMWDAYTRVSSSTGNSYPDVTRMIKQYMADGALVMNYNGHGVNYCISHEQVVKLADFKTAVSKNLPLWLTASCDIMAFDGQEENIGEAAVFNKNGGAVAFYGTTRTVYSNYNENMNLAFMEEVLNTSDGGVGIGEAVRLTKCSLVSREKKGDKTVNKLQYTLLGDPAMKLACPKLSAVVDSINNVAVTDGSPMLLKAGSSVVVKGRIMENGAKAAGFNGIVTATVSEAQREVVCKLNNTSADDGASTPYRFKDRSSMVFKGSDNVDNGAFLFTFAVPKDISYSSGSGLMNIYAVSEDKTKTANGENESFVLNGSSDFGCDSIGPSVYCYINTSSFTNGDYVNPTPYFIAEITDEDGINVAGNVGHDMQLTIDGDMTTTYVLNDYFSFDFGSYKSGTLGYSIPALAEGPHRLQFRVWDILNNSSTVELAFNVARGVEPSVVEVDCTKNPATTSTSFRIIHDRIGTEVDIVLDVFDMSGRHLWTHAETDVPTGNAINIDWDLTTGGGNRLGTGVYLYRVQVSSDGSSYATKAKKLIILSNK